VEIRGAASAARGVSRGKGLLHFSIDKEPSTRDPFAKNIYCKVPGNGNISYLTWRAPTSIVATVGASIVRIELDMSIVSVHEDDVQQAPCDSASGEYIVGVFTIDGRRVFEGQLATANEFLTSTHECLLFVRSSFSGKSYCEAQLKCP